MNVQAIRLQKYLAQRGVASRRQCEQYILLGRVVVNGKTVTQLGTRVVPGRDRIELDGQRVEAALSQRRTIMLNKPTGYICSASARQGRTVYELIPELRERLLPVGRLDKASEGLLLLSNDGELINELTHPRHGHVKVYLVTVRGTVGERALQDLRSPIEIDGKTTRSAEVARLEEGGAAAPDHSLIRFTLREGRNRQIRRLCAAAGFDVVRLVRVCVGALELGGLAPGRWRDLSEADIRKAKGSTA